MVNEEQTLEVIENGEYFNIGLKTKLVRESKPPYLLKLKDGQKQIKYQGIEDGNYIIAAKVHADGFQLPSKFKDAKGEPIFNYSCKVNYQEEEVSFFLTEEEHEAFKDVGGENDKIKISMKIISFVDKRTGVEREKQQLSFELVD